MENCLAHNSSYSVIKGPGSRINFLNELRVDPDDIANKNNLGL